jgi:hypothetical protein
MATRRPPARRGRPTLLGLAGGTVLRRLVACAGLLLVLALAGGAIATGLRRDTPLPRPPRAPADVARPAALAPAPSPASSPVAARRVAPAAGVAGEGEGALPVVAPPSVPAALVDAVLAREGSPLAGQGAYIVVAGRRSGVDPVFLLAFVSHFDLSHPLPATAHNVGHIRASGGEPAVDGYRVYPTWQAGVDAWYALIHDRYAGQWGLRTLDAIAPVYAPSTQAGVEAELADLRAMIAAWRAGSR